MSNEIPWAYDTEKGRVAPRQCIRAAREAMDKAWQTTDSRAAVIFLREALDWQRRALEQMAQAGGGENTDG